MDDNQERLLNLESEIVSCRKCPRLVAWREEVARVKRRAYLDWDYWGKPVPGFGDPEAQVLVVGLAPGAHGANRTGRMFTGDGSGDFLYPALHRAGFASQSHSVDRQDGLQLANMFISAVCRCVPPANKPKADEIRSCLPYLRDEIELLRQIRVIVALGRIAFDQTLKIYRDISGIRLKFDFQHLGVSDMGEDLPWLVSSYHPSRQNTQTGRLTQAMFDEVWSKVNDLIK